MIKSITKKVPGGKLFRIDLEIENKIIKEIKITGDFFLHPEETIEKIENILKGREVKGEELIENIQGTLVENNAELIGVSPEDIINAIKELMENERI